MRPRSSLQSVLLYNSTDSDGSWIPTKVEINSWVTLSAGRNGGHAKDSKKHGGSSSMDGSYKAKVVKFRLSDRSDTVSEVLVQHAYMWRQLDLNPAVLMEIPAACNYLYPSAYEDWVDSKSIQGIIVVIHAEIGELIRGSRSHKELLKDAVFFYNAFYTPRSSRSTFGHIQPIPLPDFHSPDWPLPDMHTSESFRARLWLDFQNSMKPNIGSKQTRLSWFMPIGVFVDLFSIATGIHRTPTMFVFKHMTDDLCSSLMDRGWDCKITFGADVIKCVIPRASLICRYHIGRSTLYALFVYNRHKMLSDSTWEAIDQYEPVNMVSISCEMEERTQDVEVGMSWTFWDIRQEVLLQLGLDTDTETNIVITTGDTAVKINSRQEKKFTTIDVLPPKIFRLVPVL